MGLGTRRRKKNQARVVISLDIDVSPEYLQAMPVWLPDAVGALRTVVAHNRLMHDDVISLIREIDSIDDFNVTAVDVQVSQ